jgi:hypothetical protein
MKRSEEEQQEEYMTFPTFHDIKVTLSSTPLAGSETVGPLPK